MCFAPGPQPSDANEERTRGPSVSSQALYYQSSHYDFENKGPRALFVKKWMSLNTKEYSLLQKIGVPAPKMEGQNCKLSVSESSDH